MEEIITQATVITYVIGYEESQASRALFLTLSLESGNEMEIFLLDVKQMPKEQRHLSEAHQFTITRYFTERSFELEIYYIIHLT